MHDFLLHTCYKLSYFWLLCIFLIWTFFLKLVLYFDMLIQWLLRPDIFMVLSQQLQSADVLASHRIFLILFRTLKELSTKRLTSDQRNFAEVQFLLLYFFCSLAFSCLIFAFMLYIENLQNAYSHYWNSMQTSIIIFVFERKNLLYKRKSCLSRLSVSIMKRSWPQIYISKVSQICITFFITCFNLFLQG